MDGTTLCPHCDTRFKIMEVQLEAHHGMVRCGHCLQAFDARPGFIPDQPSPQLELPILNEPTAQPAESQTASDITDIHSSPEASVNEHPFESTVHPDSAELNEIPVNTDFMAEIPPSTEPPAPTEISTSEAEPAESGAPLDSEAHTEVSDHDPLDFSQTNDAPNHAEPTNLSTTLVDDIPTQTAKTLAEQIAIIEDEHDETYPEQPSKWPWLLGAIFCLLLLIGQAAYFFRVDLAAHLPGLKPALTAYCQLLQCTVSLPRKSDLMSIESSDLAADPALENQITLNALLRNRATFSQAFPHLELTLNDTQDKPLARRSFKPSDYLPPIESESFGLLPNHEIGIKLHLDVTDLKPTGYRLVLFYPDQ